jgi:hypothetical protein
MTLASPRIAAADSLRPATVAVTDSVVPISREDREGRSNMVAVNPLKFFLLYNFTYAYVVSPGWVVAGAVHAPTTFRNNKVGGVGFMLEVQYFPRGSAHNGFHLVPNVAYTTYSYVPQSDRTDALNTVTDHIFTAGMLVGWTWEFWYGFPVEVALGGDYNAIATREKTIIGVSSNRVGVEPTGRVMIGYRW